MMSNDRVREQQGADMKNNEPEVAHLAGDAEYDTMLFCDLKTDEEKSTFFLSGRGYETGVIAQAIQNDVAMAYHRCSEYRKELEALRDECERWKRGSEIRDEQNQDLHSFIMELKAECEKLRKDVERYRWLRADALSAYEDDLDEPQLVYARECVGDYQDCIDAAIDKAMQEEDNDKR